MNAASLALADMDRAKIIAEEMQRACETFLPPHAFAVFASYNLQLERTRIQPAGSATPDRSVLLTT